jgi:hypothetical protein
VRCSYTPTPFSTGAGTPGEVYNAAGTNEGSCKTLAFARLHGLSAAQATALFAQHAADVAAHPEGASHQNIRALMASGWDGVRFEGTPLRPRA